jgi:hypothetical protein
MRLVQDKCKLGLHVTLVIAMFKPQLPTDMACHSVHSAGFCCVLLPAFLVTNPGVVQFPAEQICHISTGDRVT